jgi:ribosomal protein S18 acetylase RimI-like enzyme
MEIEIRPLKPAAIPDAVRLLGMLNPDTPSNVLEQRLREILENHPHYHTACAYRGSLMAGFAGAWIATKIWCGRYLEIDNLVVDPDVRSAGIGTALIRHFECVAATHDCKVLALDSYVSNHASHRLYHRLGFEIWGFHFIKPLGDWRGDGSDC